MPKSSTANRTPCSASPAMAASACGGQRDEAGLHQLEHQPVPRQARRLDGVAHLGREVGVARQQPGEVDGHGGRGGRSCCGPARRPRRRRCAAPSGPARAAARCAGRPGGTRRAGSVPRSGCGQRTSASSEQHPAVRPDHRLVLQHEPVGGDRGLQLRLQLQRAGGASSPRRRWPSRCRPALPALGVEHRGLGEAQQVGGADVAGGHRRWPGRPTPSGPPACRAR